VIEKLRKKLEEEDQHLEKIKSTIVVNISGRNIQKRDTIFHAGKNNKEKPKKSRV